MKLDVGGRVRRGPDAMRASQSTLDCERHPCKREWWRGTAALFAGLGLSALAVIADVAAQSREVYIGSTGNRDARSQAYPGAQQQQRSTGYGSQRQLSETDGLLEDAVEDLARGRITQARRLLELVIEGFSDSRSADEARRLLAPIYAGTGRAPSAMPPPQPNAPAEVGRNDPIHPASIPASIPSPMPAQLPERDATAERQRKAELVRLRSLNQDFRSNVGDRVFFAEASTDLGTRSRGVLAAQAAWLKRNPDLLLTIEAHADDHGGPEFNRTLAQRRANAVQARLVEEGIDPARIRVNALGKDKPVATCTDDACAAQNRRVVTLIETVDQSQRN